jgi:hypothetical protein
MTTEHPLLAGIRESVRANGVVSRHWGELRREVFPGQPAWINLRAWCADNELVCELIVGESSREAEVQFCKAQLTAQDALAKAPVVEVSLATPA